MTRPRFKLRGALLLGTLIPLLLVAAVAIVVTSTLTASLTDADASQRSEAILVTADEVLKDVIDAETGMRGFVITGQDSFLAPYHRGTTAFASDNAALRELVAVDTAHAARVKSVNDTFVEWQAAVAVPVIAAIRSGATPNANGIIQTGEGKARIDQIRDDIAALTSAERAAATKRFAASRDTATTVRRIAFYGTLVAIILGVIIAIVFARRISRRVRSVSTAAALLASGNLAGRVPVEGHDEVADLAASFNEMATQLEKSAVAEKQATEDLRRRTIEAEQANRELEAFSYSVSHDLRAPLRSLDGFSQALMEDYGARLDDTAHDYLARVRAASQRMGQLIDDLLRLARLSREPIREEPIDLSALSTEVVGQLRAAEPDRVVQVKIQPGMKAVGDTRLVRIALDNLIGNAWKFTRERADARIDVRAEPGADGTEYVVADNGAGFDMRYATNLFGPFQRMHTQERFSGTGIGLATVQRIVHRHGGRIRADSEVDQGARFHFSLGGSNAASAGAAREGVADGL